MVYSDRAVKALPDTGASGFYVFSTRAVRAGHEHGYGMPTYYMRAWLRTISDAVREIAALNPGEVLIERRVVSVNADGVVTFVPLDFEVQRYVECQVLVKRYRILSEKALRVLKAYDTTALYETEVPLNVKFDW